MSASVPVSAASEPAPAGAASNAPTRPDGVPAEVHARDPETGEILTYTPGYLPHKIGMIAVSLLLVALACVQLVPALRTLAFGHVTQAEADHIVKTREGAPEETLRSDADWRAYQERRDRSAVFWNVYRFTTREGRVILARAPVGSHYKPPHALLDADGLPTQVRVAYLPASPEAILLPLEFSTWFFPGTLAFFGFVGVGAGALLAWHARRPIPVPQVGPPAKAADQTAPTHR